MPIFLLLLALVTGCSADTQRAQDALDSYASYASDEQRAAYSLTGSALISFENSRLLLQTLGYQQAGSARFELEEFSFPVARGCLDLSQISTISRDGVLLPSITNSRVAFTAKFDSSFLITALDVSERQC
jgi:hypothetical protein